MSEAVKAYLAFEKKLRDALPKEEREAMTLLGVTGGAMDGKLLTAAEVRQQGRGTPGHPAPRPAATPRPPPWTDARHPTPLRPALCARCGAWRSCPPRLS